MPTLRNFMVGRRSHTVETHPFHSSSLVHLKTSVGNKQYSHYFSKVPRNKVSWCLWCASDRALIWKTLAKGMHKTKLSHVIVLPRHFWLLGFSCPPTVIPLFVRFWYSVLLYSLGWLSTCPQPPKYWDYRRASSCSASHFNFDSSVRQVWKRYS